MKTVSGKIVSTKTVSLSKAANILSNFVSSDNGASQPVAAYLRRASAAFNELVYVKKQHRVKKHSSKEEASTKSDISRRSLEEREDSNLENGGVKVEIDEHRAGEADCNLRKKEKKRKKTTDSLGSGETGNAEVEFKEGNETLSENNEEKKKKKKKRKSVEADGGETGNAVTPEKKKRRRTEADD